MKNAVNHVHVKVYKMYEFFSRAHVLIFLNSLSDRDRCYQPNNNAPVRAKKHSIDFIWSNSERETERGRRSSIVVFITHIYRFHSYSMNHGKWCACVSAMTINKTTSRTHFMTNITSCLPFDNEIYISRIERQWLPTWIIWTVTNWGYALGVDALSMRLASIVRLNSTCSENEEHTE